MVNAITPYVTFSLSPRQFREKERDGVAPRRSDKRRKRSSSITIVAVPLTTPRPGGVADAPRALFPPPRNMAVAPAARSRG